VLLPLSPPLRLLRRERGSPLLLPEVHPLLLSEVAEVGRVEIVGDWRKGRLGGDGQVPLIILMSDVVEELRDDRHCQRWRRGRVVEKVSATQPRLYHFCGGGCGEGGCGGCGGDGGGARFPPKGRLRVSDVQTHINRTLISVDGVK